MSAYSILSSIFLLDLLTFTIKVFDFIRIFTHFLYYILEGSFRAILPINVLKRKSVKGDIVLITGGGAGIGRLMAKEFGSLGAKIIIWDINETGIKETIDILQKNNIECWSYKVDISKKEQIYETAEKVKSEIGDVDILINNAGIGSGKKIFDCDDNLMELTIAVNLTSHFFTTKAFLPSMLKRNHGHIVSISSLAGRFPIAGLADYCASKFGVIGFSEALSEELLVLKKNNIHVTTVCPFYMNTKMFEGVVSYSPLILPILDSSYVVERILEAVLTNTEHLYLPKISYLGNALYSILPIKASRIAGDYLGINASMEDFKNRKKHL
uniref:Estradiol 17-beta-dehydrogenase 11 n=1 Tax=Strongyloides papillosus TaxID=174720 RepID=A0A0N5B9M4_STREA